MIVDVRFDKSAAGFDVRVQANVAVTAATWGVQDKPIARAVVAPALIVCVAFDVMAIEAVLAATEHDSESDPPFDPGVNTFTTWLPVVAEPDVVNVGPAASEAVGADGTGAAGVTRLNDAGPGGWLLSVPVKSLQSVLVASRRPISPLASIAYVNVVPDGKAAGTVRINSAILISAPMAPG